MSDSTQDQESEAPSYTEDINRLGEQLLSQRQLKREQATLLVLLGIHEQLERQADALEHIAHLGTYFAQGPRPVSDKPPAVEPDVLPKEEGDGGE